MAEKNRGFKKTLLATAFSLAALSFSSSSMAQVPCDPELAAIQQANASAILNQKAAQIGLLTTQLQQVPHPKLSAGACLDVLRMLDLTVVMGLPSIGTILNNLIQQALNAACQAVMTQVNQTLSSVNSAFSIPGIPGIPGSALGLGLSTSGQGGIVVNGQQAGGFGDLQSVMYNQAQSQISSFQTAQTNAYNAVQAAGASATSSYSNAVSNISSADSSVSATVSAAGATATPQKGIVDTGKDLLKNVF